MTNLEYESAYLLGARIALQKYNEWPKGSSKAERDNKVYARAELDLFLSSNDAMKRFLSSDGKDIRYKNHVRDKKGRLIKCEAYFI